MNIEEQRLVNFSIIERWKKSNKNTVDFCKENNIKRSSFYYWHRKYKDNHKKVNKEKKFIPVNIVKENNLHALEGWYPNGAKRLAVLYSLLLTCNINQVNPYEYLKDILTRAQDINHKHIKELLPNNWIQTV